MLHSLSKKAATAFLLATSAATVNAQVYQPPVANEFIFGNSNVKFPQTTSNHALAASASYFPSLGLGSVDLYVAGWNDPEPGRLSEVTVILTPYGVSSPIWTNSIMYSDVQDLEVASRRNPAFNETTILVAYYKTGAGHFLDEYRLVNGGPPVLIGQDQLSASTTYGRIQMDFHALWSGAVAWIDPSVNRIRTRVYENNAWSPTSTLNGTANKTDLDIALEVVETASGSNKELHFAYSGSGFVTESFLNFNTLLTAPGTYTPSLNDNVSVGSTPISRLTLDCPGFSNMGSRWAYTYSDVANVYVRFKDPAIAPWAQSVSTTNGMLGNVAIAGSNKMFSPTINYDYSSSSFGLPADLMIGWYTTDGGGLNKYIALKMDPTGSFVTSLGDYLDLPNAQTPTSPVPLYTGIALNKTDVKARSSFSYATYFDRDPVSGASQLHHAFHTWSDPAFRGLPSETETPDVSINAYPNPFNNQFSVSLTAEQNSVVELLLTDMNGRTVAQTNNVVYKGQQQINMSQLNHLASGNYVLTVLMNQKKIATKKVTKQ